MNPKLEGKLSEFGKALSEHGPGFLKFVAALLVLFPENTKAFKIGDKLRDVFEHLPR